jgi:hypothetical protein
MTLLVATKEGDSVWMIADTAITGGTIDLRARYYRPKIEAAHNTSLIGYAGDHYHGQRIVRQAALPSPGRDTLDFLVNAHRQYPSVDLAYAYRPDGDAHLFRIVGGSSEEVETLHLGDASAFERFQEIRHGRELDHAPNAIHQFMCAARDQDHVPEGLSQAIVSMLRLFPMTNDRSVGGWPVPYLLTPNGTQLCGYAYSVTDPITDKLAPGGEIPHGTPEAGGFGLSLTSLREDDGMVVYWQQAHSGRVYLRNNADYDELEFFGGPTAFKEEVRARLGREVNLWFSDVPLSVPEAVTYLHDEQGRPRFAVARAGHSLSFAWVQSTAESFRTSGSVNMRQGSENPTTQDDPDKPMRLDVLISPDQRTATIVLRMQDDPLGHMILDAAGLELLIKNLAGARAVMEEPVAREIASGTELISVLDPAWRTRTPPHPSVPGPLLALRHPGFGWISFVLPDHEARSLGQWLLEHARPPRAPP